ncbi:hypothetical protein CA54_27430 [Symmachiella macrocystis]|uniref:Uncharacterized protein n=1 Tax=Symmachiella macrocystis TaxID=2527985 RepID=A0A5C6BR69_9PLAN|nr:hypothetical protein [Symmachiella macrocystis]TWU13901.1 hypothetical protein CA54_27430 [Symmachiella macrocystis]
MRIDKKTKEAWVHEILNELEDTMKELGFKRASKHKYKKVVDGCESRYLFSIRHPRYGDDPHQLYVNPCVQVVHKKFLKACCEVYHEPRYLEFATLGGSLGLYIADVGNSQEWPVDDEKSAKTLVPQLLADKSSVAVPFWEHLDSLSKVLDSIERNDIWAQRTDSWKYKQVVLLFLERGIDESLQFVIENKKKFREIDIDVLRAKLLALE